MVTVVQSLQEGLAGPFGKLAVGPRVQLRLHSLSRVGAEEGHGSVTISSRRAWTSSITPSLGHEAADPDMIAA